MICNAVLFDKSDEIRRRMTCKRRLGKVRIAGDEVFWSAVNIREIAAAAAGDEDFLSGPLGTLEHGHAPPALSGLNGAHQPGGPCPQDNSVIFVS